MVSDDAADEAAFLEEFGDAFRAMAVRFADCPGPDLLRAAAADAMPPRAAASIRAHIEHCALCGPLARDLSDLPAVPLTEDERGRIRERVAGALAKPRAHRRIAFGYWSAATAAAGALAASLAIASVVLPGAPPVPLVQPPAHQATPPVPRPSALQFDKPPLKLPLDALLVLRGASKPRDADVAQGLACYRRNDFRGAVERLQRVVPDKAIPQLALYLGVSYLHADDPARAEKTLIAARASAPAGVIDDVDWYLAMAHVQLGQIARARAEFDRLCRGEGDLPARACAASVELSGHD